MIRGSGKWAGVPEADRKPDGPPTEFGFTYPTKEFGKAGSPAPIIDVKAKALPASGLSTLAPIGGRNWGL